MVSPLILLLAQTTSATTPEFPVAVRDEQQRFAATLDEVGDLQVGELEKTRTESFDRRGRLDRWEERGPDGEHRLTWIAVFEDEGPSPSSAAYWSEDQALPFLEEIVSTSDGRIQDVLYGEFGRERRREMRTYLDASGREVYQEYFAPRSQLKYSEETYRYDQYDNLIGKLWRRLDGKAQVETRYEIESRDGFGRWTSRRVAVNNETVALEKRTIVDGPLRRTCPPASAGPVEPSPVILPVPFARGVVSTRAEEESSPSFTGDGQALYFTRYGQDWAKQRPMVTRREDGAWREAEDVPLPGPIYNAAISAEGERLLFCRRDDGLEGARVLLAERLDGGWQPPIDLSERDGFYGSYFHFGASDDVTYHRDGELYTRRLGSRDETALGAPINTPDGVEFAAWSSPDGQLLLFTRSVEKDPERSGVFASRSTKGSWGPPRRLALPYGWGACLQPNGEHLVYVLEGEICRVPVALLKLP